MNKSNSINCKLGSVGVFSFHDILLSQLTLCYTVLKNKKTFLLQLIIIYMNIIPISPIKIINSH